IWAENARKRRNSAQVRAQNRQNHQKSNQRAYARQYSAVTQRSQDGVSHSRPAATTVQSAVRQPDTQLAAIGGRRCLVDACPGVSDRIELRDAEPGEAMLLLNDTHQPAGSPYRASHAIDVREAARRCCDAVDCVPDVLSRRWISLRAFDAADLMIAAEPATGRAPGARSNRCCRAPASTICMRTTPGAAAMPRASITSEAVPGKLSPAPASP
ncbi:MAG: DUF1203 domain-containing protein, partial [Nevskiales bacterium]|nr:DUF1203 domain-containing protein [Nevskiales bacterium]